jgi:hypothetical protein
MAKKENARQPKPTSAKTQPDYIEQEQFELLPPPEFNPQWPERGTLPAEALERFLTGERVSQIGFGVHRGWRLAAYVQKLEDLGWPFKNEWVKETTYPRKINRYWLEPKTIIAARAIRVAA